MKLFHGTTTEAANAILRDGFRDTPPHLAFEHEAGSPGGVWLADAPVDENEGARGGDVHLMVEVPDDALNGYEIEELDHPNRTFVVPANVLNIYAVAVASDDELEAALAHRWQRLYPDGPAWRS